MSKPAVDLKALLEKMEHHRDSAVVALDHAIASIRSVHRLDRQLVATGMHDEEQIDHSDCDCRPGGVSVLVDQDGVISVLPVTLGPVALDENRPPRRTTKIDTPKPNKAPNKSAPKSQAAEKKTAPQSSQANRFTDEQKVDAVALADRLGSDAEAARQVGCTGTSIRAWRRGERGAPNRPAAAVPPRETPASAPEPKATQNRYTDAEKDAAVDLAIQLGSDKAAGQQLGIGQSQVSEWHRKGFGTVPEAKGSPAAEAKAAGPAGPTMHCPECKASLPIEGVPDSTARALTLRAHYKASPTCEEAIRTKVGVA